MTEPRYRSIAAHYEACLEQHGDSHLGVDWPNAEDVETRHSVMLDVIRRPPERSPVRLLDVGCGAAHLYERILRDGGKDIAYEGLDIAEPFVALSREKFPGVPFHSLDVLAAAEEELPRCDYAVMNGVFTEKVDLSFEEMLEFFQAMVVRVFGLAEIGIAFNVMSKHVDWERDDLFHLPFDDLATFLTADVSRNFVIRNDYGLYEYTAYVYR
jgi:SAM-dependent methyltransferase